MTTQTAQNIQTIYVEFLVSSWCNRQVASGSTLEEAEANAAQIANGEENITWINECSAQEAEEIRASW